MIIREVIRPMPSKPTKLNPQVSPPDFVVQPDDKVSLEAHIESQQAYLAELEQVEKSKE